jgi:hypothetical protein
VLDEEVEFDEAEALLPGSKMNGPPSFEFVASDGVPEVKARIAAVAVASFDVLTALMAI